MMINSPKNKLTKTELAESLGISRSTLYYHPKRPILDLELREQIEVVMSKHPSYGHRRIALELQMNKKKIRRVMRKFSLKPYRRRIKSPVKPEDLNKPTCLYQNEIKVILPLKPNYIWVADFTYLEWQEGFVYLATIMDLFTREIIGWNISLNHDKELVLEALNRAFQTTQTAPTYHHSDQGSEYESTEYINELETRKIIISMSKKSSPWENAYQESFYSQFKLDLGRIDRFETLGESIEAVYQTIHYYNTERIHTSLKTSPIKFKNQYLLNQLSLELKTLKNISFPTYRQLV